MPTRLWNLLLVLQALLWLAACPSVNPWPGPGGDDDDLGTDDDDTAGDDDDSFGGETASYPEEEQFLGLAVGNTWRYDEVVSGGPEEVVDDVIVEILGRIAGPLLTPPQANTVVAFEFDLDRLFGRDEKHWYTLDGTGTLRWAGSRIYQDFFEFTEHEGDGSIVMMTAADELGLIGATFEGTWFLADIEGMDFSTEVSTIETFWYGTDGAEEVETLGLVVSEAESYVGLEYFKAEWGVLGLSVDLGSTSTEWIVTECSVCPESAGL